MKEITRTQTTDWANNFSLKLYKGRNLSPSGERIILTMDDLCAIVRASIEFGMEKQAGDIPEQMEPLYPF